MLFSQFSKISSRMLGTPVRLFSKTRHFTTYYTQTHEWLKVQEGETKGKVGITDFAQSSLGDLVYCELEEVGKHLKTDDVLGVLESVKASSDIHVPICGEIIEINNNIIEDPFLINTSPQDEGWLVKITIQDDKQLASLLSEQEYNDYLATL